MPDLEVCGYGKRNRQLWKIFPRGGGDIEKDLDCFCSRNPKAATAQLNAR